jgi:hypothetical protein
MAGWRPVPGAASGTPSPLFAGKILSGKELGLYLQRRYNRKILNAKGFGLSKELKFSKEMT